MKTVLLPRLPWWFWVGWAVHLVAYALPSYQMSGVETAPGWKCAQVVWEMWFSGDGVWRQLGTGQMDAVKGMSLLGWFNVTNLTAILAPWLVARVRRPALAWWTALLCATGAAQAVAFGLGMITGEPEYRSLRVGFYVWLVSYLWLAIGAAVIWRRARTAWIPLEASPVVPLPS